MKRYNLLVPQIFPQQCPPLQQKLDASTERKLKKLYEYLEKNPGRGPKVSGTSRPLESMNPIQLV